MLLPIDDLTKIHLFTVRQMRFVLDVNSCVFFETDEVTYRILELLGTVTSETELVGKLAREFPRELVATRLSEIRNLVEAKELFTGDPAEASAPRPTPAPLSLCLNVAHRCNLSCQYCFAHGNYGADRLMSKEVAENAVDFLIENSAEKDLSISFFGGEPLLNLPVVKHTVAYAKGIEKARGKEFRFHITTNGTLLSEEILRYLDEHQFSMIISLDGPKEVNDRMRPFRNGRGSYDVIQRNLKKVAAVSPKRPLTVRSTYTHQDLDVDNLALHLFEIGCKDVSVEPCATESEDLQITKDDLPTLKQHYDTLADRYLVELLSGKQISFFHFRSAMDQVRRKTFRLTQCGAANGYLAVGAEGNLYPCHKFVGNEAYVLGDVFSGIKDTDIQRTFHSAYVPSKKKCMNCWARYACGGGCHAHAISFNNDILEPYDVECELIKHRVELGAYLYTCFSDSVGGEAGTSDRRKNRSESAPTP